MKKRILSRVVIPKPVTKVIRYEYKCFCGVEHDIDINPYINLGDGTCTECGRIHNFDFKNKLINIREIIDVEEEL